MVIKGQDCTIYLSANIRKNHLTVCTYYVSWLPGRIYTSKQGKSLTGLSPVFKAMSK